MEHVYLPLPNLFYYCSRCHFSIQMSLLGTGVVDCVWHSALNLLRQGFLQCLGHLAIANRMADLAGLGVRASVVDGIGQLVLELRGRFLLHLARHLGLGGVGDALAFVVLHVDGDSGRNLNLKVESFVVWMDLEDC